MPSVQEMRFLENLTNSWSFANYSYPTELILYDRYYCENFYNESPTSLSGFNNASYGSFVPTNQITSQLPGVYTNNQIMARNNNQALANQNQFGSSMQTSKAFYVNNAIEFLHLEYRKKRGRRGYGLYGWYESYMSGDVEKTGFIGFMKKN